MSHSLLKFEAAAPSLLVIHEWWANRGNTPHSKGAAMKRQSRTGGRAAAAAVPATRHLPLVDLLVDTRTERLDLAVRSGLKVLEHMLEEDRTALCGPQYVHHADRVALRAGTVPSEGVLGGRKVALRRPRVRAKGRDVPLPTFRTMANTDPLNRRVVEQLLVGVATRQYARRLDPPAR